MIYRISEIFGPTIQGEGALAGAPTVFVRFGGCDFRCAWCDTMYAVDPMHKSEWAQMTVDEIVTEVERLADGRPLTVTFSGGNPALYDCTRLVQELHRFGYTIAVETQGSMYRDWLPLVDHLIVSPKPPSSRMAFNPDPLRRILESHHSPVLKFVVGSREDFDFARDVATQFPRPPVYLQPCNLTANTDAAARDPIAESLDMYRMVIDWTLTARWYTARVLPQLHLLTWGPTRGV